MKNQAHALVWIGMAASFAGRRAPVSQSQFGGPKHAQIFPNQACRSTVKPCLDDSIQSPSNDNTFQVSRPIEEVYEATQSSISSKRSVAVIWTASQIARDWRRSALQEGSQFHPSSDDAKNELKNSRTPTVRQRRTRPGSVTRRLSRQPRLLLFRNSRALKRRSLL